MSLLIGASSGLQGAAGSGGAASDLGATIDQGLRFISANSTKLTKTLGTPTDRDKWSWSCWVKKAKFDEPGRQVLFGGFSSGTNNDWLEIGYEHTNELYYTSSGLTATSSGKYRDPSAWQHVAMISYRLSLSLIKFH